jgi:hypothetical protein
MDHLLSFRIFKIPGARTLSLTLSLSLADAAGRNRVSNGLAPGMSFVELRRSGSRRAMNLLLATTADRVAVFCSGGRKCGILRGAAAEKWGGKSRV